jgi:hypothetical protein
MGPASPWDITFVSQGCNLKDSWLVNGSDSSDLIFFYPAGDSIGQRTVEFT